VCGLYLLHVRAQIHAISSLTYAAHRSTPSALLLTLLTDPRHQLSYLRCSQIHAINSLIIKLSKLTIATTVYRGFCYAKLPDSFWTRNSEGLRCGIEYGFSSTTTERSVAVHYGTGPAGTIFEMPMGLTDRGAELAWLSQCGLAPPRRYRRRRP
jgi:hypothetical protein